MQRACCAADTARHATCNGRALFPYSFARQTQRKLMHRILWVSVALGPFTAHANAEVAVIVNPKNPSMAP